MKRFISVFLFLLFLQVNSAYAQDSERGFDQEELQELRTDDAYVYELVKPEPEGFLERLWNRFVNWFWSFFQSEGSRSAFDIFFKLLIVTGVVYFFVKVMGADVTAVFKPNKENVDLAYDVDEETLNQIDFEQELRQATAASNYRLVIRLYYLMALKQAADANWLNLTQGKTNYDYLYDLKGKSIENDFKSLSYLFDYTWYGHFDADQQLVALAKEHLDQIKNRGGGMPNGGS